MDFIPSTPASADVRMRIHTGSSTETNVTHEQRVSRFVMKQEHECPYVNCSDGRCAEHLNVTDVGYAFDHCFDEFARCPVYAQRLAEEQQRRQAQFASRAKAETAGGEVVAQPEVRTTWDRFRSRITQLTLRKKPLASQSSLGAESNAA